MEAAALSLLLYLVMNSLESGETGAEISLNPKRLQFFKYGTFYVSCEEEEEEERTQWRVTKRATDGEVTSCPSPCRVSPAYPSTDTGVYWCETGPGSINSNTTTNNINISTVSVTITDGAVLLESPVRPVAEGDDVTLRCRTKGETSVSADFYKDGVFIGSSSATGDMTIRNISRSDEGLYRCNISGGGEGSPDSWVKVKAPPGDQEEPLMSTATVLRHLVVAMPYLLSTVVLGLIYRDRRRELQADETQRPSDDVIMEIAI